MLLKLFAHASLSSSVVQEDMAAHARSRSVHVNLEVPATMSVVSITVQFRERTVIPSISCVCHMMCHLISSIPCVHHFIHSICVRHAVCVCVSYHPFHVCHMMCVISYHPFHVCIISSIPYVCIISSICLIVL